MLGKISPGDTEFFLASIVCSKLTSYQLLLLSDGLVCGDLQQSWLYLKLSPSNSLHLASIIFRNKKMGLIADDF